MSDRRFQPGVEGEEDAAEPAEAWSGSGEIPAEPVDREAVREAVLDTLRSIYDPEIPVNIYDLGLIYRLDIDESGRVGIDMTLTAPACPVAGFLVEQVARRVGKVPGVSLAHVQLVWDPPWTRERMSEAALLDLGLL